MQRIPATISQFVHSLKYLDIQPSREDVLSQDIQVFVRERQLDLLRQLISCLEGNRRIEAIKTVREATDLGLKQAKDLVEVLIRAGFDNQRNFMDMSPPPVRAPNAHREHYIVLKGHPPGEHEDARYEIFSEGADRDQAFHDAQALLAGKQLGTKVSVVQVLARTEAVLTPLVEGVST